jgi:hypothetical protein
MRTALIAMAAVLLAGLNGTCAAMSDADLERLITREIAPMVDEVGGAAIAVRMDGRTKFASASSYRKRRGVKLQHVPTAMNRDSQDTPEVRV